MSQSLGSLVLKGLGSNIFLFIISMLLLLFMPIPFLNAFILPVLLISSFIFLSEWFRESFWKQFLINISFTATLIWIVSIFLNAFGPVYMYIFIIVLIFSIQPSTWWNSGKDNVHKIIKKNSIKHVVIRNFITLGIFVGIFFIPFLFLSGNATGLAAIAVGVAFVTTGFYGASLVLLASILYHSLTYKGDAVESTVYTVIVHAWFLLLSVMLLAIYLWPSMRVGPSLFGMVGNGFGIALIALLTAGFSKYISSRKMYQIVIAIGVCLLLIPLQLSGLFSVNGFELATKALFQERTTGEVYDEPLVSLQKAKITAHPNGTLEGTILANKSANGEFTARISLDPYIRTAKHEFLALLHTLTLQDYNYEIVKTKTRLEGGKIQLYDADNRVYDDFYAWYSVPRDQRPDAVDGPLLTVSLTKDNYTDAAYLGRYFKWDLQQVNESLIMRANSTRLGHR